MKQADTKTAVSQTWSRCACVCRVWARFKWSMQSGETLQDKGSGRRMDVAGMV